MKLLRFLLPLSQRLLKWTTCCKLFAGLLNTVKAVPAAIPLSSMNGLNTKIFTLWLRNMHLRTQEAGNCLEWVKRVQYLALQCQHHHDIWVKSKAQTDSKQCPLFSKPCSLSLIRNPLPRKRTDNSKYFLPHEFTFSQVTCKQTCLSLRDTGRWKATNLLTTSSTERTAKKISPKEKGKARVIEML